MLRSGYAIQRALCVQRNGTNWKASSLHICLDFDTAVERTLYLHTLLFEGFVFEFLGVFVFAYV